MYTVNFDKTQLIAAVAMLASVNDEVTDENVQQHMDEAVHMIVQAVDEVILAHGGATDPFEYSIGAVTAVVWPLPGNVREQYGHTHEVSFFVNPGYVMQHAGAAGPDFINRVVRHADNDPARFRYIHVRAITSYFIGDQLVHEETNLNGGYTVCFVDNQDGSLSYAVAKCHKNDNYNRKIGRDKSRERLATSGKTVTMTINEFRPWIIKELGQGNWK